MISAAPAREDDERNNWNTPVVLNPSNSSTLYYGTNKLYRTLDRAVTWSRISDDLTDGLHPSGSLTYGTITTIAPASSDSNTIYVGTDDGNVQVTLDGGERIPMVHSRRFGNAVISRSLEFSAWGQHRLVCWRATGGWSHLKQKVGML